MTTTPSSIIRTGNGNGNVIVIGNGDLSLPSIINSNPYNLGVNLNDMGVSYNNASANTNSLLKKQTDVLNIIESEKDRLEKKKREVDNVYEGKRRGEELLRSSSKRYSRYTDIMIIFIFTLGLYMLMIVLSNRFTFIPSIVFEISSIIIISVGIYLGFSVFIDVATRNKMNFDELELGGLQNPNPINGNVLGNSSSTGLGRIFGSSCADGDCCSEGTVWDENKGMCVVQTFSGFTTLSLEYKNGNFIKPIVKNDSPYEFSNYTPV